MDYRQLGPSGRQISALTLGTMTLGGDGSFARVGNTDGAGARRQIDMCRDDGFLVEPDRLGMPELSLLGRHRD